MKENGFVIVTGMELPENCYYCRFNYDHLCHALQCSFFNYDGTPREMKGGRLVNCPLKSVVRGEWINEDVDWICSICGHDAYTEGDYRQVRTNFCPNCGAEMKEAKNEP